MSVRPLNPTGSPSPVNPVKQLQVDAQALQRELAYSRFQAEAIAKRICQLRQQLDDLKKSIAWRAIEPALRAWMNPASLGRGETILDDISRLIADLGTASETWENSFSDPLIAREFSAHFLDRVYEVSILVLNRNGGKHLERFLSSYAKYHAQDFAELVIVDHGSVDDSLLLIRSWMDRLPIKLLCCSRNQRFSVGNNLARGFASGQALIFANNDIVFDQPALPALLRALDDQDTGMAGLPLYYADDQGRRTDALQHAGIRFSFDWAQGFMRPHNHQQLSESLGQRQVAAVTAALAACRADSFDAAGGFEEGYDYGFEDVDLCLKFDLDLGLRNVLLTDVSALHCEFGTQSTDPEPTLQSRRAKNAQLLKARFGQQLVRCVTRSQFSNQYWHSTPFALSIANDPALARNWQAAERLGLSVSAQHTAESTRGDLKADAVLVTDPETLRSLENPRSVILILKVSPGTAEQWLEQPATRHADLLWCRDKDDADTLRHHSCAAVRTFTPAETDQAASSLGFLSEELLALMDQPGLAIKIATPADEVVHEWGDFHFAESLGRALRDLGYRIRVDLRPDWLTSGRLPDDVSLALRGIVCCQPLPGLHNLLWLISHPQDVEDSELEQFDHVFVASEPYSLMLSQRLRTPVSVLLQCTDTSRFNYVEQPTHPQRVLFVGNSRGIFRPIVKAAIEQQVDLDVYGTHWQEFLDRKNLKGESIANAELGGLYGNSGAVLNDHWDDMKQFGFVSNRVFDVLATGTLLVTDPVRGLEKLIDYPLLTFRAGEDNIQQLLEENPADRESRRALAEHIAEAHSFAARAAVIAEHIARSGRAPSIADDGSARH